MIEGKDIETIIRLIGDKELNEEDSKVVKKLALLGKQISMQEKMREDLLEIRKELENL